MILLDVHYIYCVVNGASKNLFQKDKQHTCFHFLFCIVINFACCCHLLVFFHSTHLTLYYVLRNEKWETSCCFIIVCSFMFIFYHLFFFVRKKNLSFRTNIKQTQTVTVNKKRIEYGPFGKDSVKCVQITTWQFKRVDFIFYSLFVCRILYHLFLLVHSVSFVVFFLFLYVVSVFEVHRRPHLTRTFRRLGLSSKDGASPLKGN